ncbi:hypothetical protein KAFR_0G03770 [Kazachstania africana CBS 2517]|uniref:Uncharacterized protein n=1 Tax=Kazachstania africana (strain ATCC 22294 / BCRC 22015 / CBS 2517 / CECT 1963 / NBRC 1671 / NRRL Y-8276) TaxID=1071382 RepID=H2AYG0_KAZAF|nr:hypothetical protein KAFR_0G03770 [Kazachstania africana CBS 2517]CCF59410.1 hypothetical protein KAFR_0G03770 [Kazachstania africana CBS 2517]
MFSFLAPTVFDTLPTFKSGVANHYGNCINNDPFVPKYKRRRPCSSPQPSQLRELPSIDYSLEKRPYGYQLSLQKYIPKSVLLHQLEKKLHTIKNNIYKPNYEIVTDIFGQQHYVEDQSTEEAYTNAAIEVLRSNLDEIKSDLAREIFKHCRFCLDKENNILKVKLVNLSHEFQLDGSLTKLYVSNYSINEDDLKFDVASITIHIETTDARGSDDNGEPLIESSDASKESKINYLKRKEEMYKNNQKRTHNLRHLRHKKISQGNQVHLQC